MAPDESNGGSGTGGTAAAGSCAVAAARCFLAADRCFAAAACAVVDFLAAFLGAVFLAAGLAPPLPAALVAGFRVALPTFQVATALASAAPGLSCP